jgi:hypothetical protein
MSGAQPAILAALEAQRRQHAIAGHCRGGSLCLD